MAVTRLAPDGVTLTNLTGTLAAIQDDPDAATDTTWLVATSNSVSTTAHCTFPTPADGLTAGAGLQEIRVKVRKFSATQTGTPTARIEVYAAGVLKFTGPTVNVTSALGEAFAFAFDGAGLVGADIEARVVGTATGGSPGVRNTVDVGAVAWVANTSPPVLPGSPGGVTVTARAKAARVAWTAGTDTTSYTLERRPSGGAWGTVKAGIVGLFWTDETVAASTGYGWRVTSVNSAGTAVSLEVTAATPAAPATTAVYADWVNAYAPEMYLRLADTTTTAADASGLGRSGTYSGSYTQGVAGQTGDGNAAATFTAATGGKVAVPNFDGIRLSTVAGSRPWTVLLNLRIDVEAEAFPAILGMGSADTSGWIIYEGAANDLLSFKIAGSEHLTPAGSVVVGTWAWWALTWDGAALRWYKDGALNTTPTVGAKTASDTANTFNLNQNGTAGFGNNSFDEVAVLAVALTNARASELFDKMPNVGGAAAVPTGTGAATATTSGVASGATVAVGSGAASAAATASGTGGPPTSVSTGTGAGTASATGTGAGAAVVTGSGAGSASASGTGAGGTVLRGSGSATASASGASSGRVVVTGSGAGSASAVGAATGRAVLRGTGSASAAATATAAGQPVARGAGSATSTVTATGAGAAPVAVGTGTGAGTASVTATAAGAVVQSGTGSATTSATGAGTGRLVATGTGAATARATATGSGVSVVTGSGTGTAAVIGAGAGADAPVSTTAPGTGAATATTTTTGAGVALPTGTGSATASTTSTAAGIPVLVGAGAAQLAATAQAQGVAVLLGTGAGSVTVTAAGAGAEVVPTVTRPDLGRTVRPSLPPTVLPPTLRTGPLTAGTTARPLAGTTTR